MDTEKLIELVREHKYLYDLSDRRYSDNQRKDETWRKIGGKLQVQGKECKKSWTLLRDAFRRAVKKSKELNSGQGSVPTKKWKYEDEMSFLLPYFKERTTLCSVKRENDIMHVNVDEEDSISELSEETQQASPENIPGPSGPPLSKRRKKSTQSIPTETPSASTTFMKFMLENKEKSNNDIQHFFDSICITVQSFPPKDRAIAKAKVFKVISDMELEILNRNTYSTNTESTTSYEMQMTESPKKSP